MKRIKTAWLCALLAVFAALPLAAFEAPANGSYEEMKKLVPSDAVMVVYEDATKMYESGWYDRLKALPLAGKMIGQSMPVKNGNLIMFASNLNGAPKFNALFYWKDAAGLDELIKMQEAGIKALDIPISIEKFELAGHPGFKMVIPDMPVTMQFIQLAPEWFMLGMDDKSMTDYLALTPDKLGINSEIAKAIDPYKEKMIFGTVMLPSDPKLEVSRIDFVGDLTADSMEMEILAVCKSNKTAMDGEKAIKQIIPIIMASADQEIPGISSLFADAIKTSVDGEKLKVVFVLPMAKMDQLIIITTEYMKKKQEAQKAAEAAAKAEAAKAEAAKAAAPTAAAPAATAAAPAAAQPETAPAAK